MVLYICPQAIIDSTYFLILSDLIELRKQEESQTFKIGRWRVESMGARKTEKDDDLASTGAVTSPASLNASISTPEQGKSGSPVREYIF